MGAIGLKSSKKWFDDVQAIQGIDLDILKGELIVFVGPSGCGKPTLLHMIAGLEETSRGQIRLDDDDVTHKVPFECELSMVFQSFVLYSHLSVDENIGSALKTAGAPKAEIVDKVNAAAETLKLNDYLDRRPKDLSGGQHQRTAIGRAIVRKPRGFLFDEPLSNLDATLSVDMRFEIARLHKTLASTMVYVTPDQAEAMTLADRIFVLKNGMIRQVGSPRAVYGHSVNVFVAQFIDGPKMNLMSSQTAGLSDRNPTDAVRFGVRPEHITVVDAGQGDCDGIVQVCKYLGADFFHYVDCCALGLLTERPAGSADEIEGQKWTSNSTKHPSISIMNPACAQETPHETIRD